MGYEIRRVPADWEHPCDERGRYIPLFDQSYEEAKARWEAGAASWAEMPLGDCTWEEWDGPAPTPGDYRPAWTEAEATHFQLYENISEGTPISPVYPTLEEVIAWAARMQFRQWRIDLLKEKGWCPTGFTTNVGVQRNVEGA